MKRFKQWLQREELANVWLVIFGLLFLNEFVPWVAARGFAVLLVLGLVAWDVVAGRRRRKNVRLFRGDEREDERLTEMIQGLTNARAYLDGARSARRLLRKAQMEDQ